MVGMAKNISAGLLLFRRTHGRLEIFLVHPGGPFFARKDEGFWTIPKGLVAEGEDLLEAARREFKEETGFDLAGPYLPLGSIRQKSGKVVHAWAMEGDADPALLKSNLCPIEWPPRTGRREWFPEVDRGEWFGLEEARTKMMAAQWPLVEELVKLCA
jgi:predicted NUDIX family NTP pyrophosphohydrolase